MKIPLFIAIVEQWTLLLQFRFLVQNELLLSGPNYLLFGTYILLDPVYFQKIYVF